MYGYPPISLADGRRFHARVMPPQNVVSSRMTSTAVSRMFAANFSKLTTTVLRYGTRTSAVRRMP